MPEWPDITVYLEALQQRILGEKLERVRLASPFLLRTAFPPLEAVEGKTVQSLRRLGKRLAIGVKDDYWLVLHLMVAGRLHWREPGVGAHGSSGRTAGRPRSLTIAQRRLATNAGGMGSAEAVVAARALLRSCREPAATSNMGVWKRLPEATRDYEDLAP